MTTESRLAGLARWNQNAGRALLLASTALLTMPLLVTEAQAQTAPASPTAAGDDQTGHSSSKVNNANYAPTPDQDIVVTGTSLRGVAPVGSPLITLDKKQIQNTGAQTGAGLLATIPQLDSFGTRPVQGGNINVGTPPTLRGLPSGSTLSLLDGHRLVAQGTIATVADPSTIPVAAIERLEILPDGASSVYGSDAVGGVINVILRKDLNGLDIQATSGFDRSYQERTISVAAGKTWSTGSLLVAYQFFHNSHLLGRDRSFVTSNLTSVGGGDARSTFLSPPNVVVGSQTYSYTGSGFVLGAGYSDDAQNSDLARASDRHTVIANFRQDLGSRIHLFGDFNYGHIDTDGYVPQQSAGFTITSANPFFKTPVPGTTSETILYRFTREQGANSDDTTRLIYYGGSLGADIDISDKWRAQIFGNYGWSKTILRLADGNVIDSTALQTAVDSTNPATAFDPFDGRTTASTLAGLRGPSNIVSSVQKLYQASAKVDGPLFRVWGGDVRIAIGGEFRRETYLGDNAGGTRAAATLVERGSTRNVWSVYGEALVPLLSPENDVPLVRRLAIDGSVRYDHYSDFGGTTNPKVGAEWSPVEPLTFRASYSKSFQAPSLADLNSIDARAQYVPNIYLPNFFTPITPVRPYNILLLAGGNPNLKPQKARTITFGGELKVGSIFRFSATYYNVHFSNAINYAAGAFTNPTLYARYITANPTQAQVNAAIAQLPTLVGTPIPASQIDYIDDLRRYNLGRQNIAGIDFGPMFDFGKLGGGELQVGANGNYIFQNESQPAPNAPFVDNLTANSTPRWRVRGYVNYLAGPFTANVFVNYIGAYNNNAVAPVQRVDDLTTVDLNLSYDFRQSQTGFVKGMTLQLNVQNLLDKDPPLLRSAPGYSGFASPLGRLIQVTARVRF